MSTSIAVARVKDAVYGVSLLVTGLDVDGELAPEFDGGLGARLWIAEVAETPRLIRVDGPIAPALATTLLEDTARAASVYNGLLAQRRHDALSRLRWSAGLLNRPPNERTQLDPTRIANARKHFERSVTVATLLDIDPQQIAEATLQSLPEIASIAARHRESTQVPPIMMNISDVAAWTGLTVETIRSYRVNGIGDLPPCDITLTRSEGGDVRTRSGPSPQWFVPTISSWWDNRRSRGKQSQRHNDF